MLIHHNKDKPAMITRLSNMALDAATALLVSVVFIGNSKYGGFEKSWTWMHVRVRDIILTWAWLIVAFVLADPASPRKMQSGLRRIL